MRDCSPAKPESIRIHARCRTSIRTCSAKARSSARASTTSMHSSSRSGSAFRKTASSATTCWKVAMRARGCSATSNCMRTIRRAIARTSTGATAGSAATGRSRRWLLPRVRGAEGASAKNPLSALSRWKMLDNLRRSLVPVALTLLLLLGWIVLPAPSFWTLAVLASRCFPVLGASLAELLRKPRELVLWHHCARPRKRRDVPRQRPVRLGMFAPRNVVQRGRHPAHRRAHADHPPSTAAVDGIQRGYRDAAYSLLGSLRSMWVYAGAGGRNRGVSAVCATTGTGCCGSAAAALADRRR